MPSGPQYLESAPLSASSPTDKSDGAFGPGVRIDGFDVCVLAVVRVAVRPERPVPARRDRHIIEDDAAHGVGGVPKDDTWEGGHGEVRKTGGGLGTLNTEEMNGPRSGQWPIDWLSARIVKRIGCFHSDVDFGVATHLADSLLPHLHLHLHHHLRLNQQVGDHPEVNI